MEVKPKILVLITNSDRAGAQVHVLSLITGLKDYYDFFLYTGTHGFLVEECKKIGVETRVFSSLCRSISPVKDYKSYKSIVEAGKQLDPKIIHVHSAKAAAIGRLVAYKLNVSSIYTVHGWPFSAGNKILKRYTSCFIERAFSFITKQYIAVSDYDYRLGVKHICRRENIVIIHNGIENCDIVGKENSNDEIIKLCTVVRFAPQKNVACMLRAVRDLDYNFILNIAGSGSEEQKVREICKELGVEKKVFFHGEIVDVDTLLRECDLFLLSSDWEGLPIALLEAARAHLPIVATNVGGVSEIVEDGVTGFLVNRNDHRDMSKKILRLAIDKKLRNKFSVASNEKFKTKFILSLMLKKTNVIYQKLLQEHYV